MTRLASAGDVPAASLSPVADAVRGAVPVDVAVAVEASS